MALKELAAAWVPTAGSPVVPGQRNVYSPINKASNERAMMYTLYKRPAREYCPSRGQLISDKDVLTKLLHFCVMTFGAENVLALGLPTVIS